MANPNVTLLAPGTQAIVSIQPNYDCSLTIPANEVVFPAGTGYSIQLANPGNATEVRLSIPFLLYHNRKQ